MSFSGILGNTDSLLGNLILSICDTTEVDQPIPVDVCDSNKRCEPACLNAKYVVGGKEDKIKLQTLKGALVPAITVCRDKTIINKYCQPNKLGKYCGTDFQDS